MEMATGQEPQVQPEARKAPLWEDIVDVFVSPAALFRRKAQTSWVTPWLVLSVIFAVLYFVFLSQNNELAVTQTREMMARVGRELPAAAQQPPGLVRSILTAVVGQPILLLIFGVLLGGFLLWVAAAVAQRGPSFKQAMMIMAWAAFPGILQKLISGVLVLMKTSSGGDLSAIKDPSTGILRFLDPASIPLPLLSALGMVDIFILWEAVLWAVALKAICNYSTGKAAAVAAATWLLMLLPLMGMGLLGQMAMGG